jgi:hypothetical protein
MRVSFLGFFEIFHCQAFRRTAVDYVEVSCYICEQPIRQWDEGKVAKHLQRLEV